MLRILQFYNPKISYLVNINLNVNQSLKI